MNNSSNLVPVVLGGGGMRGPCAVGALDRISQEGVAASSYTGVSIGSLLSAMYANGRDADDLKEFFLNRVEDKLTLAKAFIPSLNPLRHIGGGLIDLVPLMQSFVERFNLKPKSNLRIVTFDIRRRKPFIFEGEDYDLGLAIAASCTLPVMGRPVPYRHKGESYLLMDGGLFHPHPGIFCEGPALIVKLVESPNWLHPDRRGDIKIDAGLPGSSILGNLNEDAYQQLVEYGFEQAEIVLANSKNRDQLEEICGGNCLD